MIGRDDAGFAQALQKLGHGLGGATSRLLYHHHDRLVHEFVVEMRDFQFLDENKETINERKTQSHTQGENHENVIGERNIL